jgi:hypothetical protein
LLVYFKVPVSFESIMGWFVARDPPDVVTASGWAGPPFVPQPTRESWLGLFELLAL